MIEMGLPMSTSIEAYIPAILFVDDEQPVLRSIGRFCRQKPWTTHLAGSGEEGLKVLEEQRIDIVVSDMRMPGMSGAEFLTAVREKYPETIRILLTGYSDIQALEAAINEAKIYNYITKPWDDNLLTEILDGALRLQASERERKHLLELTKKQNRQLGTLALSLDKQVKERTIEIEQALGLLKMTNEQVQKDFHDSLRVLTHLIEWQEDKVSNHSHFVSDYSQKVAEAMELTEEEIQNTRIAGMLHNIGMLALPDSIRKKALFKLDEEEMALYKTHPVMGEVALDSAPGLKAVAKIIRHHREYVNGSGFPDQLIHNDIPMSSKIICVVSDYHDVFHGRIDRNQSGHEDAKNFISAHQGKRYESRVVELFFDVLGDYQETPINGVLKTSSQLKPGMNLINDVLTPNGLLLLTEGMTLTEQAIDKLIQYEHELNLKFEVYINDGATPS